MLFTLRREVRTADDTQAAGSGASAWSALGQALNICRRGGYPHGAIHSIHA
jgi:hypothetical protein